MASINITADKPEIGLKEITRESPVNNPLTVQYCLDFVDGNLTIGVNIEKYVTSMSDEQVKMLQEALDKRKTLLREINITNEEAAKNLSIKLIKNHDSWSRFKLLFKLITNLKNEDFAESEDNVVQVALRISAEVNLLENLLNGDNKFNLLIDRYAQGGPPSLLNVNEHYSNYRNLKMTQVASAVSKPIIDEMCKRINERTMNGFPFNDKIHTLFSEGHQARIGNLISYVNELITLKHMYDDMYGFVRCDDLMRKEYY